MKMKIIIMSLTLVFACCKNRDAGEVRIAGDFEIIESVSPKHVLSLGVTDKINSMHFINGNIVFVKDNSVPLFDFYDVNAHEHKGGFGRKGHGKGEFLMPNLFCGMGDTIFIIDDGRKELYCVYNGEILKKRKMRLKVPANDAQTLSFPYVGYYGYVNNAIEWNVYDVLEDKVVQTVTFSDERTKDKVFYNTFSWDFHNGYAVFASMYFDKFRIVRLSSDKSIDKDVTYARNHNVPQESKCYYSDICCNEYIYLLSQRNVKSHDKSAKSEIEVYNYSGEPVKKIKLDDFYLYMVMDKIKGDLYLYNPRKEAVVVINGV